MNQIITNQIPSIVRWALALLGSYLTAKGFADFEGADQIQWTGSLLEILTGLLAVGITLGLKKASETGANGWLANLFVGPKVQSMSNSIARWLIAIIAGSTIAWLGMNADQLSNASLATIISAGLSFAIDRIYKRLKP